MNILSIESSCDDSAISLTNLHSAKLIWDKKISQESAHSEHGGVVPELASRLFAKDLPELLDRFRHEIGFDNIHCICATNEPGLSASLLEGMMMAKALALSLKLPLIPINHLKGHVYSLFINQSKASMPLAVLLVSGGHSMILECYSYNNMRIISSSLDDSFGECYDKASKMLSLGYPGGAIIDSIATNAMGRNIDMIKLPIPLMNHNTLNFSFSGLKNAFRLKLQENPEIPRFIACSADNHEAIKNHEYIMALCLGFQYSAVRHLILKCKKYLKSQTHIKRFAIVGGASANSLLRKQMQNLCDEFDRELLLSDLAYCSDNAAMIGRACIEAIKENNKILESNILDIDISPRNTQIENAQIANT